MYGQYRAGAELGDNIDMRKHFANQALAWADEIIKKSPKLPHGYRYKGKKKEIQKVKTPFFRRVQTSVQNLTP